MGGDAHDTEATSPGGPAKGILENRYALGEIDDEEFAHRMSVLKEERQRLRAEGG